MAEKLEEDMELTREQKVTFYEEGYLVLEGVISHAMIDAARQAINHEIGKGEWDGIREAMNEVA